MKFIDGIVIHATQINLNQLPELVNDKPKEITIASVNNNINVSESHVIENASSIQFKYAQLLNVEIEQLGNHPEVYEFIDRWWHTRYVYGGTGKSGIDCSAFTGVLHKELFGNSLPRSAKDQYQAAQKILKDQMQMGDLVFFNTTGGVSHVGVYLTNGYFVHSACSSGVTINNLSENYYKKRFVGSGRIKRKSSEEEGIHALKNSSNNESQLN